MADYPISTTVTLYAVIRSEAGEQVEPASVVLRVKDPSGTVTDLEPTAVDDDGLDAASDAVGETLSGTTGVYQAQIVPDTAGTWDVHWQSTGPTVSLYRYFQVPWPTVPLASS